MGQVSVEGVGLPNVTVTMTGEGEDETDVTDAGGLYGFSKLRAGNYSVAISGFDPDEVEFTTTSMNVSVALGETANIPFDGTLLRTSGISGRVSVEGMALDGVEVTLAGAAEGDRHDLQRRAVRLRRPGGGHVRGHHDEPRRERLQLRRKTSATIVLGDAESNITNFEGTHTRTAGISGVLFIDEVMQDKMHTAGEPSLTAALAPLVASGVLDPMLLAGLLANAKVIVRGPSLNDPPMEIAINADGSFTTGEALVAGSYQVELPANNEMVAAALAAAGVAFVGESSVVTVAAGGMETVNFPFWITHQTINVGANMGNDEMTGDAVEGVELALYPTAQDAEDGTNMLGEAQKTGEMGMAMFDFARADDSSPGGGDSDNIVFVKVAATGHDDLVVSDNDVIEIEYPGHARVHAAPAGVRLLNVAVNIQFWIKSTNDAPAERGGDMGLGGWATAYCMPMDDDPETEEMDPVVCTGDDATFMTIMMGEGDDAEPALTDDGMTVEADMGKASLSFMAYPANLPAMVYVRAAATQAAALGEKWDQTMALMHSHDGLILPENNDPATNTADLDKGPIYVKFTTQRLSVAVYRELDDEAGFTDYRSVLGGDARPNRAVSDEFRVELMVENDRGRLETYDYSIDDERQDNPRNDFTGGPRVARTPGEVTFTNLPANEEFTVRFHAGSGRVAVGGFGNGTDVDTYGKDLEDGMSVGAFGEMSGAGPEVRLCPLTTPRTPDPGTRNKCATFAYQWATGTVSGKVMRRNDGLYTTLALEPRTSGHSETRSTASTKTGANKGKYSFDDVQDGAYWLKVPAGDDYRADSTKVDFYHDENTDDDTLDDVIGNPEDPQTEHFTVTALRSSIQGYVANDGQEGDNTGPDLDQIVRGDEALEGVTLELRAAVNPTTRKWVPASGDPVATATTDASGFYEFPDVPERRNGYIVVAKSTDDYAAIRNNGADGDKSGRVWPDEYPEVDEGDFDLPYWDYSNDEMMMASVEVPAERQDATKDTASYANFALLYKDGSFSGRVTEAAGAHDGITIQLTRCETVATNEDGTVVVPFDCARYHRRSVFPTRREESGSNGRWEFDDLLEGYYRVDVGDAGYEAAIQVGGVIDEDAQVNDVAVEPSPLESVGRVKGRRDLSAGHRFYVFDGGLERDGAMTAIVVKGVAPDPR